MTDMPEASYANIETLIAHCFAQSRILATGLAMEDLDSLEPGPLATAQMLIEKIAARDILGVGFLASLVDLEQALSNEIEGATDYVMRYDADPCNVSEQSSWREARRSEAANALTRVLLMLVELQVALEAVHDLLAAEAALHAMRVTA